MKKLSPEKLSRYVFYALVLIIAVVFVAFFAAGNEETAITDEGNVAPVLASFLIDFLFVMIGITAASAAWMLIRTMLMRSKK